MRDEKNYIENNTNIQSKRPLRDTAILIAGVVLIGAVLGLAWFLLAPTNPNKILEREIQGIQPFLDDMEILEYDHETGFRHYYVRIQSTIPRDRVLEFMGAVALEDCKLEKFICVEPLWYVWNTTTGIVDSFSTPTNFGLEVSLDTPGQLCMSAKDSIHTPRDRTDLCIDISNETLTLQVVRI